MYNMWKRKSKVVVKTPNKLLDPDVLVFLTKVITGIGIIIIISLFVADYFKLIKL